MHRTLTTGVCELKEKILWDGSFSPDVNATSGVVQRPAPQGQMAGSAGDRSTASSAGYSTTYLVVDRSGSSSLEPLAKQGGDRNLLGNILWKKKQTSKGVSLTLRVLVDRSVVEAFAEDGLSTLTARVYPASRRSGGIGLLWGGEGEAPRVNLTAWSMRSAMEQE